jgi:translation initiation factor 2 subunit 2
MDYEEMLDRGRKNLPKAVLETARFEIPKAKGHIEGNKTIISNFAQIAAALGRDVEHLLKYVLKGLATPGEMRKGAVIIGRKVSASRVNEKIGQYVKDFVLCSECKKPDTLLVRENRITFIKCSACGAKQPVKVKL